MDINIKKFICYPWATIHYENSMHNDDFTDATKSLMKLIREGDIHTALHSFLVVTWCDTPQGVEYWRRKFRGL